MKLYLIKDMPYQGRILKAGKWTDLWDATEARQAIKDGYAVPYDERHLKPIQNESSSEEKATPQSAGTQTKDDPGKAKTKNKKNN